jgi:hypothetical protein
MHLARHQIDPKPRRQMVVGAYSEDSAARGVNGGALDAYLPG